MRSGGGVGFRGDDASVVNNNNSDSDQSSW